MMRALIVALALAAVPATAGAQMHDGHGMGAPGPGTSIDVQFAAFGPANVDVLAGDKVSWMNVSVRRHDVAADDGSFDSGSLFPGGMFQRTFDQEGAVPYFCTLHPTMRGTINVHELLLTAPAEPAAPGRPFQATGRTALPSGTPISIEADTGTGFAPVATTKAADDGTFAATLHPATSGQLRAVAAGVQASPPVTLVVLDRKVSAVANGGRIRASVAPASPGATVVLQLFLREHFGWWPVSTRKLDRNSRASFGVGSRHGVRARVVLTMADGATPLAVSPTLRLPRARPSRAR
jgi:plastocyanin